MRAAVRSFLACVPAAFCLEVSAAEIKIIEGNPNIVGIFGTLVSSDADKFINSVSRLNEAVVVLHSDGGSALAGVVIGQAIRQKGFSTYVPNDSLCASACALAWLGGAPRLMSKSARIGFHAAYSISNSGQKSESGQANAIIGAYLNSLGLPLRAVSYIASASPDQMKWLNATDAQKYGIEANYLDLDTKRRVNTKPNQRTIQKQEPSVSGQPVRVGSFGDWGVYAAETPRGRVCYSLSATGGGRTSSYMFVSNRPKEGVRDEVSFVAGRPVEGATAQLFIAGQTYDLIGKGGAFWLRRASDDSYVIRDLDAVKLAKIEGFTAQGQRLSIPISGSGMKQALSRARSLCS